MTFNGWVQIALFCVVVAAADAARRRLSRCGHGGPAHLAVARAAAGRARLLSPGRRQARRGAELVALLPRHADLPYRGLRAALPAAAPAGPPAVQSAGHGRGAARPRRQHGDELHHQHQLAGLWRRTDHELPVADDGPGGAELSQRRHRHRAGDGPGARLRARQCQGHRQLLGRPGARHALRAAARLHRADAVLCLAGRAAEPFRLRRGNDAGRRQADHRPGAGGVPARHQDAGHQRRRLLQRQLGASLREPDGAVELRADADDLRDRRGADQRVRPRRRRRAPGLGHPRRHGRAVPGRRLRRLLGGGRRQSADRGALASTMPAATWRARRCASARRSRRSSP